MSFALGSGFRAAVAAQGIIKHPERVASGGAALGGAYGLFSDDTSFLGGAAAGAGVAMGLRGGLMAGKQSMSPGGLFGPRLPFRGSSNASKKTSTMTSAAKPRVRPVN